MIDKKKIQQRLNKGSKLKEYPLLNLYILVAALLQVLGQLFDAYLLKMLKPLPLLLMVIYIHCKNSNRKHLVPNLLEFALGLSLLADIVSVIDQSANTITQLIKIVLHLTLCIAFSIGDHVRLIYELAFYRKTAYLVIVGVTAIAIYYTQHLFQNRVVYSAYLSILSLQVCMALWRYEITLRSSFLFSLFGTGLLLIGGWVDIWVIGRGACLVQLLYYCGNYFLTHGALHQSNLQFEIDKLHDNMRRSY